MSKKIIKIIKIGLRHKLIAILLILALAGSIYFGYGKIFGGKGEIRYAVTQVQKGALVVSVAGSGQVSASNQIDVKPKASGEITAVYAKLGQDVSAGTVLAAIDSSDAERAVRDAETALQTAKLELDKILEPIDELVLLQSENSLTRAKESKQKAEDDVIKAYDDGFSSVSNAFLDLPGIMTGIQDVLFSSTIGEGGQWNIDFYTNAVQNYDDDNIALGLRDDVYKKYNAARVAYDKNFTDYKSASRFSGETTIEGLIDQTNNTAKLVSEAVKVANNLIQFYEDKLAERSLKPNASADTHLTKLNSYISATNGSLANLLSNQRNIRDSKDAVVSANRAIEEQKLSLIKTKEGPDELDIRAKKIAVQQKEDALITANDALYDTRVRAPFAGIVARVDVKKGDSASIGTAIATVVTKQKIAEISLNEIDIAKIKAGQKADLVFDAVPDLAITGEVVEVDALGTVSQGVVTYTVKISFDAQDDQIKTAMSVSAAIIVEAKSDVLLVPNSAIKSRGNTRFTEIVEGDDKTAARAAGVIGAVLKNPPRRARIEIGTESDEFTEVLSGLKEGEWVITRTIQPTTAQMQQQSGGLRIPGLPGGGGGGFRGGGGAGR